MEKKDESEVLCVNKKAFHDYEILEKLEVGVVLAGTEVKAIRQKMLNLSGAFVQVLRNELWLIGSSVGLWTFGNQFNHKMVRDRKLLCHRKELEDLRLKTEAKGLTAVPLKVYVKNGKIKLEIGLARGKNAVDKRHVLKEKEMKRNLSRAVYRNFR